MKKIISWGMMLAAAFTLTNCAKEIEDPNQQPESAGIPFEIVASTVDTKTVNDGLRTKWDDNDEISVFHAIAGTAEYGTNDKFEISDVDKARFTGTLSEAVEASKSYDWYVLYPYNQKITTPGEQTTGYTFIGHSKGLNQTGYDNMASLKETICPLYGVAKSVPGADTPSITMNHLSSVVAIKVTNATEEELTITKASLTAAEDIVGSYYFDITGASVVYTPSEGFVNATAVVNVTEGTALKKGESATLYLAIKPHTAKAGTTLTLSVNDYAKEPKVLESDVTFHAGKIKTLNFSYDYVEAPTTGEKYTIEWDSNSAWEENYTKLVSGDYTVKTVKNNGSTEPTVNATANDCRVYAKGSITVANSSSNITKLVFNVSSQGKKRLTDITPDVGTVTVDKTNWKVIWEGSASSVTFTVGDKAVYGTDGSSKAGQLCFDSIDAVSENSGEGGGETPEPEQPKTLVSIAVAGQTTTYTVGDTFEFDGTVTATYDDESTATVTPTSVSEPDMNTVGTQDITVSYTEGEVTAETTYTITVNEAPAEPVVATIAEFLAAEVNTTVMYKLTGKISEIANEEYGNFTLTDNTVSVYIYGLTKTQQSSNDKSFASLGLKVGDEVTLVTVRGEHQGTAQGGGKDTPAYYVSHVAAPTLEVSPANITVEADVTTAVFELSCDTGYDITYPEGVVEVSEEHSNETGSSTYTVSFPVNKTTEPIIYVITVKADAERFDVEKTVTITQKAASQGGGDSVGTPSNTACYTLSTASVQGSNNDYTKNCDITMNDITWNFNGNSKINPWRFGGKSITKQDRTIYSKTAYPKALHKVEFVSGDMNVSSWHSLTLVYSTNSDFSDAQTMVAPSVGASKTIEFAPDGGFPANCYYKFILNITVSGSKNKYVELQEIRFYGYEN